MLQMVKARDGERLVPMSDDEHAGLIRASAGRIVASRFGSGGVALVASQAPWALPLLAQWRGIAFADGAGI